MKILLSSLLVLATLASGMATATPSALSPPSDPAAASCAEHYNVVIGVSDKAKLDAALGNALNIQKEFGASCVTVEIVNFSNTVTALTPMSPSATLLKDALKSGVELVACRNSLNKFHMTEDDLFPGITSVPSGVAELVRRQKQGYIYVQP